jgi:uncharacterized protein YegP (UPF0339 family)
MAERFELYEQNKKFYWRLKAHNGEVIADGQAYATKDSAKKGCEAVRNAAQEAPIIDLIPAQNTFSQEEKIKQEFSNDH